ncbi:MAG: hypothetical protein OEY93_12665, partial [Anaerolineae bacterium]|nr:hypothetical protein [Anaerolineae bacterium]
AVENQEYDQALTHIHEAMGIDLGEGKQYRNALDLIILGQIYLHKNDPGNGHNNYKQALQILRMLPDIDEQDRECSPYEILVEIARWLHRSGENELAAELAYFIKQRNLPTNYIDVSHRAGKLLGLLEESLSNKAQARAKQQAAVRNIDGTISEMMSVLQSSAAGY